MKRSYIVVVPLGIILLSYLLLLLPLDQLTKLSQEDGPIENAGAIFFGIASILFFSTFLYSKGQGLHFGNWHTKRQPVYILFALLFFVAMGEEISWGQRIFNLETPESLGRINTQKEINLHNLTFVNGQNPDGTLKSGWEALFTSHRIFYGIIFCWLVVLPLVQVYWRWFNRKLDPVNIEFHPVWIGLLALSILVIGKMIKLLVKEQSADWNHAISEITETNLALFIAFVGYLYLSEVREIQKRNLQ